MKNYRQVAILAAKKAGRVISYYYKRLKPYDIKKKSAHDIVTKADFRANEVIIKVIHKYFPNHGILSEESGLERRPSDFFWTIDPLDGTINFFIKNPLYCTAISLSRGDKLLFSVIYAPAMNEFYIAEKGKGAFLNGRRILVKKTKKLNEAVVLLGRTHHLKSRNAFINLEKKLYPHISNIRYLGSGSLDLAFTAAGRVGGCIFTPPGLAKWDIWPGILLVKEARGEIIDFDGRSSVKYQNGIIAGNKSMVVQIQKKLSKWKL